MDAKRNTVFRGKWGEDSSDMPKGKDGSDIPWAHWALTISSALESNHSTHLSTKSVES